MNISIIIPVLNEEKIIAETLAEASRHNVCEIIVVDGGSVDRTRKIVQEYSSRGIAPPVKLVMSPRGRAGQMNAGAGAAQGDIFVFLHADCRLPADAIQAMRAVIERGCAPAGAFDLRIDSPLPRYRIISWWANARSRATGIAYGDQAMFMTKSVFGRIGGFADIPLMEDIELSGRLKKLGGIAFVNKPVLASARRFASRGVVRTVLEDWLRALRYTLFDADPALLAANYPDER
ncbi:MAG: TIGR04283 family arsenosugar biosynthesis glycosyltransferase [Nitrospirae bacterium]|nr:TIGR04283 family arsenosugar biosynthesis glycosyltransferase [Nitrospirota bacterium]